MTTEHRHGRRARRRRPFRRPGSTAAALATWAVFVAVFVILALQLRAGRDPVLGPPAAEGQAVLPAPTGPAPVVTRAS
jgi:hypothetical protein